MTIVVIVVVGCGNSLIYLQYRGTVCLESFPAAIIITVDNNNIKKNIAGFFSFISYNKSRYSGDGTYAGIYIQSCEHLKIIRHLYKK